MILSTAMMLDWLADKHGLEAAAEAGERIERAVDKVYAGGIKAMEFGGRNGTAGFDAFASPRNDEVWIASSLLAMTVVHGPNYPHPALIPPSTV